MSAVAFDCSRWDALLRAWEELDVPEGWRAEIIEGQITMTPPPAVPHNLIDDVVNRALVRAVPEDWGIFHTLGITIARNEDLFIPDFVVVPRDRLDTGSLTASAEDVLLAVEITSPSNADHDRKAKRWGYAHGPVPLYLLIDAHDPDGAAVTLYEEPRDGRYARVSRVPFGEKITLPAPFELALDSSLFPQP